MTRRLQNRIAESSATLPVACVLATLVWLLPQGSFSLDYALGWLVCAVMTYIFIEMTAVNALLRVRSRMISSLFLFMMAAFGFLHPFHTGLLVSLAVLITFYFLFRTCDADYPQLPTFHAYLFFSLGSLLWPPLLLLFPLLLWNQGVFMRSLSLKALGAAILGLLLPFTFWGIGFLLYGIFTAQPLTLPAWHGELLKAPFPWASIFPFLWEEGRETVVDYLASWEALLPDGGLGIEAALAFVLLLGLTGFVHYVRKSYDDKIHVRMKFYSLLAVQVVTTVWLLLQPQHFYNLFPILLVTTVPAAAHFFTFTRTIFTNVWFCLLTIALIGLAVLNLSPLWPPGGGQP